MDLKQAARAIRLDTIRCIGSLGAGHYGGSLSLSEVLSALYFKHMRIDPAQPKREGRDRLFLSKGHAGPALYAALANRGYFPRSKLLTLNQPGTDLPSHCDMKRTPGVDMTAGSLAQGFSCAVGAALGSRLRNDGAWIYTIIGDGESQEGQIWEGDAFALFCFPLEGKRHIRAADQNVQTADPNAQHIPHGTLLLSRGRLGTASGLLRLEKAAGLARCAGRPAAGGPIRRPAYWPR